MVCRPQGVWGGGGQCLNFNLKLAFADLREVVLYNAEQESEPAVSDKAPSGGRG